MRDDTERVLLIVIGVFLALLLFGAWWVDHQDRKEGRTPKSAKQLGKDIRAARRTTRATILGRGRPGRPGSERPRLETSYRPADGTRRPIKRGQ